VPNEPKTQPASEVSEPRNSLVPEAEAFIRMHFADKFSLTEIAGTLHVNACYLTRVYKACTGRTLLWYHHYVRCEKAKELLANQELHISQVGELVGFVSSAHFSHIFRKMTGVSPREYRSV